MEEIQVKRQNMEAVILLLLLFLHFLRKAPALSECLAN